jgi:(S)-ureidoglycine aminohydrolase
MGQTPLGETRTRVRTDHAIIATDSYVPSTHTHWKNTSVVVLISPSMGPGNAASATRGPGFAQYIATTNDESSTTCAPPGVQRCVYVLEGECKLDGVKLTAESFAYLPADADYDLRGSGLGRLLVFEKRYVPIDGVDPPNMIVGHVSQCIAEPFLGDEDARLACLLPNEAAFDMAINVFTYQSGAVLPFVETHIMEHGLYMTAGQGVYRLSESWYPVAKGDSIWMASYCPQWFVAMGKEPAQYVYYKDVNRFHLPM